MSLAFLVLCPRSPTRILHRKRNGIVWTAGIGRYLGFQIERRALAGDDPVPEPSWRGRVTAVIEVRGRSRDPVRLATILGLLTDVAERTDGAIYGADDEEFVFVDPQTARTRAKHLLAGGEVATLVAWLGAIAAHDEDDDAEEVVEAIWNVVRPALERAVRPTKKPPALTAAQVAAVAVAFHDHWDLLPKLDDVVLAAAGRAPKHRAVARAAKVVVARHQLAEDAEAHAPTTPAAWQVLVEGVAARDKRAIRRFERFVWEDKDALTRLAVAAIEKGYRPAPAAIACVMSMMPLDQLPPATRTQLEKARGDAFATALHAAVLAYRDGAGQRAAEFALSRYDHYERYRNDPLVAKPRDRDIDVAMFRGLNDALYGPARDRPQLPPRIVALVVDHRLDDARAAYVDEFGAANADAAIRDAAAYFTPDRL